MANGPKPTTVQIACDRCGTRRQGRQGQTSAELRERLVEVGWRCVHAQNLDVCGGCLARSAVSSTGGASA